MIFLAQETWAEAAVQIVTMLMPVLTVLAGAWAAWVQVQKKKVERERDERTRERDEERALADAMMDGMDEAGNMYVPKVVDRVATRKGVRDILEKRKTERGGKAE